MGLPLRPSCLAVLALLMLTRLASAEPSAHGDRYRRPSALRSCIGALAQIAWRSLRGLPSCAVFDVDNTLVDTRWRTMRAAKVHAKLCPEASALGRIGIGQVGWNGEQTALAAGLDAAAAGRFAGCWERFFWDGRHLVLDRPNRTVCLIARLARLAGAEVFYLTGREQPLASATVRQLRRLHLPNADEGHVLCKPKDSPGRERTIRHKLDSLRELARGGRHVALSLTDSAREAMEMKRAGFFAIQVDFPVKGEPLEADPTIPVLRVRGASR